MEATRPDQETEPKPKNRFLLPVLLLLAATLMASLTWFLLHNKTDNVATPLPTPADSLVNNSVSAPDTTAMPAVADTAATDTLPKKEPAPVATEKTIDTLYLQSAQGFAYTYVGEVKNGKAHGKGKAVFDNGNIYTGNFRNNQRSGLGKAVNVNGESYEGQWKNDRFDGQGTYTWKNGDRFVGHFKEAKRNGQGTLFNKKGLKIKDGNWKDDELVK